MTQYNPLFLNKLLFILQKIKIRDLYNLVNKLNLIHPFLKFAILAKYSKQIFIGTQSIAVQSSALRELVKQREQIEKAILTQELAEAVVLPYATTKISSLFKFVEEFLRQNLRIWSKMITDHPKVSFVYTAATIYIYRHAIISILRDLITYLKKYFKK